MERQPQNPEYRNNPETLTHGSTVLEIKLKQTGLEELFVSSTHSTLLSL